MINIQQLVQKVRELAEKYPNAKYDNDGKGCFYTSGFVKNGPETCGCIFGQVLLPILGEEYLVAADKKGSFCPTIEAILFDIYPEIVGMTAKPQEYWWCRLVQRYQDIYATWSEAVAKADELYPLTPGA